MINELTQLAAAVTTPIGSPDDREQLAAMLRELQINRVILEGLLQSYRVFRFTGGSVSTEPWNLVALTAYLNCPFANDRISLTGTERYRRLAETIMSSGHAIKGDGRPRSLRSRYDIAGKFDRDSSEILRLGSRLESAVATLVQDLHPSPAESERSNERRIHLK